MIQQQEKLEQSRIWIAFKHYGVKMGKKLHFLPEQLEAQIKLDVEGCLHFPAVVLYDEFMQIDLIQDFPLYSTFREQLEPVLSNAAPWDPEHRYKINTVEVYFENNITEPLDEKVKHKESLSKYTKVDLDKKLIDIISHPTLIVP